jgi:predicted DNA-binding transcriptional regulator AlpA
MRIKGKGRGKEPANHERVKELMEMSKQGLEMFITVNECAAIMGCSVGALATRKWRGAAPPYLKMGPYLIRYKLSDVVTWMNGQTIPNI